MILLSLLAALIAVFVGYPLLVLIHEIGHAVVVLAYGRSAEAVAGSGDRGLRVRLGRLSLIVGPTPRGGYCAYDSNGLRVDQRRTILIGGRVASALVALLLAAGAYLVAQIEWQLFWVLAVGALVAAFQAVDAAWPRKRARRHRTDGAQLRQLRSFSPYYVPPRHDGERAICRLS